MGVNTDISATLIHKNRIFWNVTLGNKPPLRTSALATQEGIYPRPTLLSHYDQN